MSAHGALLTVAVWWPGFCIARLDALQLANLIENAGELCTSEAVLQKGGAGVLADCLKTQIASGILDRRPTAALATRTAGRGRRSAAVPDPDARAARLPAGRPPEQALGFVAWPATDVIGDRTEARQIAVLAEVVKLRALAEIRERQAVAYSPGVGASFSDVYPDYGYLSVQAATTPQNLPAFFAAVEAIAADLRDNPIT